MDLAAEHYLDAANDILADAIALHNGTRFVGAIYLVGVSTECLLRAYRMLIGDKFDARHDLQELLIQSSILEIANDRTRKKLGAALGEIWSLWKNNYRYTSNDRLEADYRRRNMLYTVKGDKLKYASKKAIDSALEITNFGRLKWPNQKT